MKTYRDQHHRSSRIYTLLKSSFEKRAISRNLWTVSIRLSNTGTFDTRRRLDIHQNQKMTDKLDKLEVKMGQWHWFHPVSAIWSPPVMKSWSNECKVHTRPSLYSTSYPIEGQSKWIDPAIIGSVVCESVGLINTPNRKEEKIKWKWISPIWKNYSSIRTSISI